jgi:predicted RNA-binding Zn ribbon-like protein
MDAIYFDFINSEFRDFRGRWTRDDLRQPDWLDRFLARWSLQVNYSCDATTITALVALRTLLQRMTETLVEGQIADDDRAALNTILRKVPLNRRLSKDSVGYQLEMVPLERDWDWVQAEIAASFAHLLMSHDYRRLKICANTHCRWVFYDESKSRSRLYCTPDKCANLLKVRRFRESHKHNQVL